MKKLVFGLIATVMFGFVGSANCVEMNTPSIQKSSKLDYVKVSIQIDWGRVSRGCKGFGICDVTIVIDIENKTFSGSAQNGSFVLEMNDTGLKSVQSSFESNTIIIEEDFVLSNEVCKSLGLKQGYIVKTGKYLIKTVSKGFYSVNL
jgi:hypothetical protein